MKYRVTIDDDGTTWVSPTLDLGASAKWVHSLVPELRSIHKIEIESLAENAHDQWELDIESCSECRLRGTPCAAHPEPEAS